MYQKIKALADEAIKLQNKNRMDAALREISAMCSQNEPNTTSDFGMCHVKEQGCAIHPDDTLADLTPAQHAKQLAAYNKDQGITPKKGGKK